MSIERENEQELFKSTIVDFRHDINMVTDKKVSFNFKVRSMSIMDDLYLIAQDTVIEGFLLSGPPDELSLRDGE